jgi:hypothetical protein
MPTWKRGGLWIVFGVAALSAVMLKDIGTLLETVESEGRRAYGPAVFTGPKLDPRNTQDLSDAIALWRRTQRPQQGEPAAFDVKRPLRWHLGLDGLLFVPAYAGLLGLLLRSLNARPLFAWVSAGIVLGIDWAETLLTYQVLIRNDLAPPAPNALVAIQLLSLTKWAAIGACLVTAAALWWRGKSGKSGYDKRAAQQGHNDAVVSVEEDLTAPGGDNQKAIGSQVPAIGPPQENDPPAGLHQRHAVPSKDHLDAADQHRPPSHLKPLSRLFVLAGLFAALVALPAGGPLDQFPDVIRRQIENRDAVLAHSAFGLLLFCLALTAAGLLSTRLPRHHAKPLGRWVVILGACALSALFAALCFWFGEQWRLVIFAPLFVALLVEMAAWLARAAGVSALTSEAEPSTEHDSNEARVLWLAGLPAIVTVAGGIGLVRAAFPFIVLGQPSDTPWGAYTLLGVALAVFGGLLMQLAVRGLGTVVTSEPRRGNAQGGHNSRRSKRPEGLFIGAALLLCGWQALMVATNPDSAYEWGTVGVVMLGFSMAALVAGLLAWVGREGPAWAATQQLGFGPNTPWLMLLIVTWGMASVLNTEGVYHDVRLAAPEEPRYADLSEALDAWLAAQKDCPTAEDGVIPLVLAAAPGGGIRAAYWTAAALDKVFASEASPSDCAARRLFAVSGVSGGSVGATIWSAARANGGAGKEEVRLVAEDRGLAAATAGLLLRDILQPFTGITRGWRNRAALLEDGWATSASALRVRATSSPGTEDANTSEPAGPMRVDPGQLLSFNEVGGPRTNPWTPVLVLNASSVSDGCRVLLSNVGTGLVADKAGGCLAAPTKHEPRGTVTAAIDALSDLHARPVNNEGPCSGGRAGLAAVSAALLSARFPYVTPSGALYRCRPDAASEGQQARGVERITYAVDGGYQDNSGLLTLLQLQRAIAVLLAERQPNGAGTPGNPPRPRVVPWVLIVDNAYRSVAAAPEQRRPMELFVPLRTLVRNRIADESALEQMTAVEMQGRDPACASAHSDSEKIGGPAESATDREERPQLDCVVLLAPRRHPSVAAPLGWVLSDATLTDLDKQLQAQLSPGGLDTNPLLRRLRSQINPEQSAPAAPRDAGAFTDR